jgi:hypothetical protein
VLGNLTVIGSLAGGGDLGQVDLVYVSEPSTIVMLLLGLLLGVRRLCRFAGQCYCLRSDKRTRRSKRARRRSPGLAETPDRRSP